MSELVDRSADLGVWPAIASSWSGGGVVPFCEGVLHEPTALVESDPSSLRPLVDYMREVMKARRGIGLAANQVGIPLRIFVHGLPRVAPDVIINPKIVDVDDSSTQAEGCLSLVLEGSNARVTRPKRVLIVGTTIEGRDVRIAADEYLARIFQHEIDHLDGNVYVQRLSGRERDRVYTLMSDAGLDVSKLRPIRASERGCLP